ncbi:flavin reductase [Spongiactinospora gelatinilytica]|uniref:Flavin reductase n=1 Tax=Spongiactinospora gelatinilytica TaxID=2666298 RepID=A0A2W2FGG3_9ACTN|nr:flavin reductase family protein [Spongiactinospora gelatinilytica]PZG24500.1 flavin reductase [Spongiactinospora gelatinilytica]
MKEVAARAIDGEAFRGALQLHAAGVVVITAESDGVPLGLTVTTFTSASLSPPLVSFYIDRGSASAPGLSSSAHFAANILAGGQSELAARFSRKGVDRFAAPTRWHLGPRGLPLLDDVSARLICSLDAATEIGDHILLVGLVMDVSVDPESRPLVYHGRRFGGFLPHPSPNGGSHPAGQKA